MIHTHDPHGNFILYPTSYPEDWSREQCLEFFDLFLATIDEQEQEHSMEVPRTGGSFYEALAQFRNKL